MTSSSSSFDLILLSCLILAISQVQAQTTPAPGPAGPINLTAILEKNGQYTTFIRLLNLTQVGNQIENQLNSSGHQGFTVLAPTDNAFSNLKAGTLNELTVQQQVALVLYHVLPKYYSMASLQTVSNPVRTQATGQDGGQYGLNITRSANQVNVSTGLVDTQLNNALRQDFPLAVYQLDKVLLPLDLFGPKTPKPSPTPLASPAKKAPSSAAKGSSTADTPLASPAKKKKAPSSAAKEPSTAETPLASLAKKAPSSAAKGPSTAETPLASPAKKKKAPSSAAKGPSTVETPLASLAKNGPSSAAKGPSTADASGSSTRSLGWGLVIGMCLICMSLL